MNNSEQYKSNVLIIYRNAFANTDLICYNSYGWNDFISYNYRLTYRITLGLTLITYLFFYMKRNLPVVNVAHNIDIHKII